MQLGAALLGRGGTGSKDTHHSVGGPVRVPLADEEIVEGRAHTRARPPQCAFRVRHRVQLRWVTCVHMQKQSATRMLSFAIQQAACKRDHVHGMSTPYKPQHDQAPRPACTLSLQTIAMSYYMLKLLRQQAAGSNRAGRGGSEHATAICGCTRSVGSSNPRIISLHLLHNMDCIPSYQKRHTTPRQGDCSACTVTALQVQAAMAYHRIVKQTNEQEGCGSSDCRACQLRRCSVGGEQVLSGTRLVP